MWDKTSIDLGQVKVGTSHAIEYHFLGSDTISNVDSIQTSCQCSSAIWHQDSQTFIITYKAKPIPKHLEHAGMYRLQTHVVFSAIINGEKTSQRLEFQAIVTT